MHYVKSKLLRVEMSKYFFDTEEGSDDYYKVTCKNCGTRVFLDEESVRALATAKNLLKYIDYLVKKNNPCCDNPNYFFSTKHAFLKIRKFKNREELEQAMAKDTLETL